MIDDRHIPSDVTAAEWEAAFAKSPETIARELVIESVDSGFHVIATDGAKESLAHTIAAAIRDAERRGAEQGAASMRERAAIEMNRLAAEHPVDVAMTINQGASIIRALEIGEVK